MEQIGQMHVQPFTNESASSGVSASAETFTYSLLRSGSIDEEDITLNTSLVLLQSNILLKISPVYLASAVALWKESIFGIP